jgi:hypothetical protein
MASLGSLLTSVSLAKVDSVTSYNNITIIGMEPDFGSGDDLLLPAMQTELLRLVVDAESVESIVLLC